MRACGSAAAEIPQRVAPAPLSRLLALESARNDWVLYLLPSESLTEALEASLFEWKLSPALDVASVPACSAVVREETANGWREARPSTRLVPRDWSHWEGNLPREASHPRLLEGHLLRFRQP